MNSENHKNRIMIIDDDDLIIILLKDYFSDLGYEVTTASRAEEAIELLKGDHKFNLVLTDINLPGKSGLDLLKIIDQTIEDLPVILLTGMKTLDTAISALKSGAVDYITKPFDMATVRKIVEKILRKQKQGLKKSKIYGYLSNVRMSYEFKTKEIDPDILAKEIISILKQMHFAAPKMLKQYELAFTETLLNHIEHGNLNLSSATKSNDLLQMTQFEELKEERLADPAYANKLIKVIFECTKDVCSFTVVDEGDGFDWKKYMGNDHKLSPVSTDSHGRGFLMIRHIIDEVYFNDKGNIVTLIVNQKGTDGN